MKDSILKQIKINSISYLEARNGLVKLTWTLLNFILYASPTP